MRIRRHGEVKKSAPGTQLGSGRGRMQMQADWVCSSPTDCAEISQRLSNPRSTYRISDVLWDCTLEVFSHWLKNCCLALIIGSCVSADALASPTMAEPLAPSLRLGPLGYQKLPEQNTNQWRADHHKNLLSWKGDSARPCPLHAHSHNPRLLRCQHASHVIILPGLGYRHFVAGWPQWGKGGVCSLPLTFPHSAYESRRQRSPAVAGCRASQENTCRQSIEASRSSIPEPSLWCLPLNLCSAATAVSLAPQTRSWMIL